MTKRSEGYSTLQVHKHVLASLKIAAANQRMPLWNLAEAILVAGLAEVFDASPGGEHGASLLTPFQEKWKRKEVEEDHE